MVGRSESGTGAFGLLSISSDMVPLFLVVSRQSGREVVLVSAQL